MSKAPARSAAATPTQPTGIEAPYLVAAMQFWTNLNIVIWQRLAAILTMQSAAMYVAFQNRGTLLSIVVVGLAFLWTIVLLLASVSDQQVRTMLIRQVNYIAEDLAPLFVRRPPPAGLNHPFVLFNLALERRQWLYRSPIATYGLFFILLLMDGGAIALFTVGPLWSPTLFGLPLFK